MENRDLTEKSIKTLELHKILDMLAENAICEDAKTLTHELFPCPDRNKAVAALTETSDAKNMILRKGSPHFGGIKNIVSSVGRAEAGSTLSMRELLEIAQVLRVSKGLRSYQQGGIEMETCLDGIFGSLTANSYLEERIDSAIISEEEMADTASPQLHTIRRQIAGVNEKIRDTLQKIIHSQHYQKVLQDSVITMRGDRYVVPVRAEYRADFAGIVHDTSASGATLFVEPTPVVEANNELRVLLVKEEQEIERILAELSAEVAQFGGNITANYKIIIRLDFIFAKAKLSISLNGSQPELNEEGIIDLKGCRHPLIDRAVVVPIDIRLGEGFTTLVITGPNTGGKTVTLKTIGLFSLMAECGLHIPAKDNSRISTFDQVFADIGDEQSIEQSLSTFSSHMTNIVDIMNQLTCRSLVLFDELGAGTDPTEGAALAIAILEHSRKAGAMVAATTHYAEIKVYALKTQSVENASCEFDVETLRPTYRLMIGIPGRSNAFAISKRIGLSDDIIDRAKELISMEDQHFEDIISDLEAKRQAMEAERQLAEQTRYEAAKLKGQMDMERKGFERKLEREFEKGRVDARRIIEQAKDGINQIMDELVRLKNEKDSVDFSEKLEQARASVKGRLKKLSDEADPVMEHKSVPASDPNEITVGKDVEIIDIGKRGVVTSAADSSGSVMVQAGILKLRVPVSNLRVVRDSGPKSADKYMARSNINKATRSVKNELDLRGMNADEGVMELEQFIDNAVISGLGIITVIHGKGTGILRSAVQTALKQNKAVKSFRLGRYGEGETGVTIVELK